MSTRPHRSGALCHRHSLLCFFLEHIPPLLLHWQCFYCKTYQNIMKLRTWLSAGFYTVAVVGSGVVATLWQVETKEVRRLETQTQTLLAFTSEKDSLTKSLANATRSINDVYGQMLSVSGEVSAQQRSTDGAQENLNYKAQIADKLQRISTLVGAYQSQMNTTEQRLLALKQQNSSRAGQLRSLEETVTQLNATLQLQQQRAEELLTELNSAKTERNRYATEFVAKAEAFKEQEKVLKTLMEKFDATFTAFVVVGTVDDLARKGIITKTTAGFPFAGTVWQPAQNLADSAALREQFRPIDLRRDTVLAVPSPSFTFLSPHNQQHTQISTDGGGAGYRLNVLRSEPFWAQSRYLIIAVQ